MTLPAWVIRLNFQGDIVITKRDLSRLTDEDLKLVRMVMTTHFKTAGVNVDKSARLPEAGEEVFTRKKRADGKRVLHRLDEIVNFFTVYRRKRFMRLAIVAQITGLNLHNLNQYENGARRPFIEALRDWGYGLGFDIMPVPVPLAAQVRAMVNRWVNERYLEDLNRWGNDGGKPFLGNVELAHADFSPGREFLRDSFDSRSTTTGQAAGRDVSDPARTRGSDEWLG